MQKYFPLLMLVFLLAACFSPQGGSTTLPEATQTATLTPAPTKTVTPTEIPTETPTAEPSATPTEKALSPEDQMKQDMQYWKLNPADYKVEYDTQGKIMAIDGKGKLVYWDGRWSNKVIEKLVMAINDYEETGFTKASGTNMTSKQQEGAFKGYRYKLYEDAMMAVFPDIKNSRTRWTPEFLEGTKGGWGFWAEQNYGGEGIKKYILTHFVYRKRNGEMEVIPVFDADEKK